MPLRIDRCTCFQQTFARLKAVADATGADSVEALQRHAPFGHKCRLCHAYARRMLRTGETVFHEIVRDQASANRGPGEADAAESAGAFRTGEASRRRGPCVENRRG